MEGSVNDRYECCRCGFRFEWRRPQRCGRWVRKGRADPLSGLWDPEYGEVEGGEPYPSCPKCGHAYVRMC